MVTTAMATYNLRLEAQPVQASPGGSNYTFYSLGNGGTDYHCFGAPKNYNPGNGVDQTVNGQLAAIYNGGAQKHIRFSVSNQNWEEAGNIQGVTCNSQGAGYIFQFGNFETCPNGTCDLNGILNQDYNNFVNSQYYSNLRNFIIKVAQTGFTNMELTLGPAGGSDNDPNNWGSNPNCAYTGGLCEPYFSQDWDFMLTIHQLVDQTIANNGLNLSVKYDLWSEHAPVCAYCAPSGYESIFLKQIWVNWNITYGKSDTVGMSFPGQSDLASRVDAALQIYDDSGYGRPTTYEIHLYDNAGYFLQTFDSELRANNDFSTPVEIGEAYYNDGAEAGDLVNTIPVIGRAITYLMQWPLQRNSGVPDISVAPPSAYDAWSFYGF
jgi:hypothetical protein